MQDDNCFASCRMSCFKERANILFFHSMFVTFMSGNTVFSNEETFLFLLRGKFSDC